MGRLRALRKRRYWSGDQSLSPVRLLPVSSYCACDGVVVDMVTDWDL
jgi:hypothetical protein